MPRKAKYPHPREIYPQTYPRWAPDSTIHARMRKDNKSMHRNGMAEFYRWGWMRLDGKLVGTIGFEPTTSSVSRKRSNQLSYAPASATSTSLSGLPASEKELGRGSAIHARNPSCGRPSAARRGVFRHHGELCEPRAGDQTRCASLMGPAHLGWQSVRGPVNPVI